MSLRTIEQSLAAMEAAIAGLIDAFEPESARGSDADVPLTGLARTEAIEAVLHRAGKPLSPVAIWALLREAGRDDPKMEVQVTTYDLWRRTHIDKVGRGLYVAKEHRPPDLPPLTWEQP